MYLPGSIPSGPRGLLFRRARGLTILSALFVCLPGILAYGQRTDQKRSPPGESSPATAAFSLRDPRHRPDFYSVSELSRFIDELKAEAKKRRAAREAAEKRLRVSRGKKSAKLTVRREARSRHQEEEETGVDFLEAKLFYLRQRAYPKDRVDWSAYQRALNHRARMPAGLPGSGGPRIRRDSLSEATALPSATWEYVGPRNLPVPYRIYYGQGSLSGRINAVAYTPAVDAPAPGAANIYYLGAAGGGVWKSTNFGRTWTPLSDKWPFLNISSIAIDPTNADTIYVGIGDPHGFIAGYGQGLMKSTDGGKTWRNLGRNEFGATDSAVTAILVDPENPNIVTVAEGLGAVYYGYIWRSTNGGETWTKALDRLNGWSGLAVGARNFFGDRYYYAVGGGEIWRSEDRGATWQPLSLPNNATLAYNPVVAASQTDPTLLYILSGADQKIYRSTDAGLSWSDVTGSFPGGYNWSQWFYNYHITTSFSAFGDVVYVGQIDLVQSPDAARSWQSVGLTYTPGALTHNDQHSMAINPRDADEALVGNDGGIYRLTYDPLFNQWSFDTSMNRDLGVTQFYRAAYHPYDPTRMLGGTQDNATPMARGDLKNWRNVGGGDGGFCEINPLNPRVQYATAQGLSIYYTNDEWLTSYNITPFTAEPRAFIAPIALDPSRPQYLYAGTNYLYRWDERTGTWTRRLGGRKLSDQGVIMYIAVAPSDGNRIYTGSSDGELYMTTDGGNTWRRIDARPFPNRTITSIAVHPSNPSRILVTVSGTGSGHVWRCDNTASLTPAWTDISGAGVTGLPDIPTNSVTLDGNDPMSTYYVATDVGVFATNDGGGNWSNITEPLGLPNVHCNDIKAVAGTGYLNVATFGRGVWRLRISAPASPLLSFTIVPQTVQGGKTVTGVIKLMAPALQGGQEVALSADRSDVVTLPSKVTVVAGLRTKSFPIPTKKVSAPVTVNITAVTGGIVKSASVRITP